MKQVNNCYRLTNSITWKRYDTNLTTSNISAALKQLKSWRGWSLPTHGRANTLGSKGFAGHNCLQIALDLAGIGYRRRASQTRDASPTRDVSRPREASSEPSYQAGNVQMQVNSCYRLANSITRKKDGTNTGSGGLSAVQIQLRAGQFRALPTQSHASTAGSEGFAGHNCLQTGLDLAAIGCRCRASKTTDTSPALPSCDVSRWRATDSGPILTN